MYERLKNNEFGDKMRCASRWLMARLSALSSSLLPAFLCAALLSPLISLAKPVQLKGAVYSPQPGVICDKKGGFCADAEGIAVALTKLYLGDKAEKRLMDMIRPEPGIEAFDATTFVLTNRVACDCKAMKCTVSKLDNSIDAAHTKALFGK